MRSARLRALPRASPPWTRSRTSIAAAVEQQTIATREISQSVQQAALGTREVSANITGVNDAAVDTGRTSGEVLSASQILGEEAQRLSKEINRFMATLRAA